MAGPTCIIEFRGLGKSGVKKGKREAGPNGREELQKKTESFGEGAKKIEGLFRKKNYLGKFALRKGRDPGSQTERGRGGSVMGCQATSLSKPGEKLREGA